jgi:NAD(P)-dependent dehydrogenase (short-subunit alcohol dehydrogenase family)
MTQTAIITGATQGLGLAIARRLAEAGFGQLVITGRSAARGEAAAEELRGMGAAVHLVVGDLADVGHCRDIVAQAISRFGHLDSLINAAGMTDRGTILDTSPERYEALMAVNLRAPFFLIQDAAKAIRNGGIAGTIVNVSSIAAHGGHSFVSAYSAAKAGLSALTRNAAFSLLPDRIRVNAINLGWMDSPGEQATRQRFHGAASAEDRGWLEDVRAQLPFGRLIAPDEAARLAVFLATGASGLMTGSVVDYDQTVIGCSDAIAMPDRLADQTWA